LCLADTPDGKKWNSENNVCECDKARNFYPDPDSANVGMCLECSSADNRVLNAAGDECNCDASNKFSEGTGNDDGTCVCDSAKFLVMNDDNNACVCNAVGMFVLNETTKLCECNASDNFVLA
jgi:hypothetical protein